jgi:MFS family permease
MAQILLLITLTTFTAKTSWRLALISSLVYILLSISIYNSFQFYVASFINGFALFFFFIFYNIAHFKHSPQEKRGYSSALMFIVPSLIGIIAPLLAGYIAQVNLALLWIISLVSFFISFYLVRLQENFQISYKVKAAIKEIKATRVFIFVEGVWEAMVFGVIPVYTLYFIKTPLKYGIFLSYLALVSIIANFTLGKITDRLQRRTIFLYPLTIIMACTTILFVTVKSNLASWIILTGVIQFLLPLFWNISTAMVIDKHTNLKCAIPGRELLLATGRILGLSIAFISFTIEKSPHYIFIVLGLILFLYPIILFWNTKVSKTYSYL